MIDHPLGRSAWARRAMRPVMLAVVIAVAGQGTAAGAAGRFEEIDAHVAAFADASGIPGAAYAIVGEGEVLHVAAFGAADGDGRAMTPQTPVVVGSVGKSITALAVRQLVEAGRIDLDARVTGYLPWFALAGPPAATDSVTIRTLLDHTSGLSTADGQDARLYVPGRTPEDVVRGLATVQADRPAGTYEYSNLNYVVLGVVLEAVTGQTYGAYLADHVFGPLGMTRSFTSLEPAVAAGLAQGHRYLFGVPGPFDEPYPSGMVAAGYQVSTAEDMAHFVAALANGGVYDGTDVIGSPVWTGPVALGTDWQSRSGLGAGTTIAQSGSTLSFNADILVQPARRLGVVVLFNANPTQLLGLPAGAADLALDVLRLETGSAPASSAPGVRTVYALVDAILLVIVGMFVIHLVRVRSWRRRLSGTRHRRAFIGRFLLADILAPAVVLLAVPLLIGSTGSSRPGDVPAGWTFATWTLPDLAWTALALTFGALVVGVVKLAILRAAQPPVAALAPSAPGVTGSPLAAER